jgi:hypothetical protein
MFPTEFRPCSAILRLRRKAFAGALCLPKLRGQCGMNKMAALTELRFAAINLAAMKQEQRILIISCGIIPG